MFVHCLPSFFLRTNSALSLSLESREQKLDTFDGRTRMVDGSRKLWEPAWASRRRRRRMQLFFAKVAGLTFQCSAGTVERIRMPTFYHLKKKRLLKLNRDATARGVEDARPLGVRIHYGWPDLAFSSCRTRLLQTFLNFLDKP